LRNQSIRALYSQSSDCWFDSQPLHCQVMTLAMLFTHMCMCLSGTGRGTVDKILEIYGI